MPIVTGPGIQSFSNLKQTAVFSLTAGSTVLIPAGRLIVAIYSADADTDDIRLEIQSNDGWEPYRDTTKGVTWEPIASAYSDIPGQIIISNGVDYRFRNSGAGDIPGLQYIYMEI